MRGISARRASCPAGSLTTPSVCFTRSNASASAAKESGSRSAGTRRLTRSRPSCSSCGINTDRSRWPWDIVASVPPSQGLAALLASRFMGLWGASDPVQGYGLDNGPFYAAFFDMGNFYKYMTTDPQNFDTSDYIIVWGQTPSRTSSASRSISSRRSRTARRSSISGCCSTARRGSRTSSSPVRPGSDPALSLTMANLIIQSGRYKKDFLLAYTVAPFLVRDDDDMFMRDADGNYLVWDEQQGPPRRDDARRAGLSLRDHGA